MENTTTNYSTIIISVLMAVVIIATVMMPIITATTQTATTTEIDNEGGGWLALGYNEGTDYNFSVGFDEGDNFIVGTQTGEYANMICYADPNRTLFVSGDNWYLLTNGESPSVYKFTDTASVTNNSGTLTILDGSETVYTGESPTWAYVPDANGVYGFFTDGGLNLEEGKPKVAVGSYAGVFAYNNTVVALNDLGTLGLTMSGDYAEGEVIWMVSPSELDTLSVLPTNTLAPSVIDLDPISIQSIDLGRSGSVGLMSANPPTGTQIGDLFYTFSGTDATVVGYSSSINWASFTSIPNTVDYGGVTYTVTRIGDYAFQKCSNLVLTSLPAGLTSINRNAFENCTSLALTSLPSGVTSIDVNAFSGCTNLALTSLPSGLMSIGSYAFSTCPNITLTSLPSGLTVIEERTFYSCTNLALTSLPSGLMSIGSYAFSYCTNLALTSLPSGITSIGSNAFNGCTSLALTSLPAGLTNLGVSAFSNCTNLALTSLPAGLTTIYRNTFTGCTNLALTSLPSGLTTIGDNAFKSCRNIALTSLPSGLTTIGSEAFNGCTNLALTSLPDSITSIGGSAFQNCANLDTMIIQSSPTIGNGAFSNSGVKELLNLGETEITTTSYGLNADSVQDYVSPLGYIAPTSIHETVIVEDTSLSATLLKLLPVFMVLTVVIFIGYAMFRPDSEFVKSLKSR